MCPTSKWHTDFHKLIKSRFKIAYTSCICQGISNLSIHDVKKYPWLVLNLMPNGFYSVLSYSIVRQSLFYVHSLFHTICDSNALPYLNPLAGFDSKPKNLICFLLNRSFFPSPIIFFAFLHFFCVLFEIRWPELYVIFKMLMHERLWWHNRFLVRLYMWCSSFWCCVYFWTTSELMFPAAFP